MQTWAVDFNTYPQPASCARICDRYIICVSVGQNPACICDVCTSRCRATPTLCQLRCAVSVALRTLHRYGASSCIVDCVIMLQLRQSAAGNAQRTMDEQ